MNKPRILTVEAVKALRSYGQDDLADAVAIVDHEAVELSKAYDTLAARLAEAEHNEGTLLGMIQHQRDVLRECLPYLNESMAGRRPGRSADDIRAAVKALTTDSATVSDDQ